MEYLKVVEYNVRQKNESARLNAFQADKIIPGVKGRFIDGGLPNNGVYNATSPTTPNWKLDGGLIPLLVSTSLDIMLSYFIFADEKLVFYAFLRNTNVGTVWSEELLTSPDLYALNPN